MVQLPSLLKMPGDPGECFIMAAVSSGVGRVNIAQGDDNGNDECSDEGADDDGNSIDEGD